MNPALESIDKFLAVTQRDVYDIQKELAFAILALDKNDAATLRWLAACAITRAEEIDPS